MCSSSSGAAVVASASAGVRAGADKGALLFQECGDKVTRFVYYCERDRALADLRIEE